MAVIPFPSTHRAIHVGDYQQVKGRHISLLSFPILRRREGGVTLCFRDITACCSAQFIKGEFSKISQSSSFLETRDNNNNNKYHHVGGSSLKGKEDREVKDKRFRRENDLSPPSSAIKCHSKLNTIVAHRFTNFLRVYRKIVTTYIRRIWCEKNRRIRIGACRREIARGGLPVAPICQSPLQEQRARKRAKARTKARTCRPKD